jgi:antitoxin PrlF
MPRSTLTSKGQITIPKEVRDQMGLKPGDRIDFVKDRTGRFSLKAINTDFRSLRGILKSKRTKPLTIREMDEAIARGACGE